MKPRDLLPLMVSALISILPQMGIARGDILIFCGAASKPATEEIIGEFEKSTGIEVDVTFGGSGTLLSQMLLSKKGDIYAPGSPDYMEIARRKGAVLHGPDLEVAYLVPAINVKKGNPKKIRGLKDLLRPDVRVGIANPETVCIGAYAVEIVESAFNEEEKRRFIEKVATYFESCEKTGTAVIFGNVDAVIGWSVFEHWNPERIETVPLKPGEVRRISFFSYAISTYSRNRELAGRFIEFARGETGRAKFRKYGYFVTPEEAFSFAGGEKPMGGIYKVPHYWIER